VFATFICVHDFPHGEVSLKVSVMEYGLLSNLVNK